jgi:hypothetical protein
MTNRDERSDWSVLDRFIDALDTMNGAIARIELKLDALIADREEDERSRDRMRGFYLTDSQREALATAALQKAYFEKKLSMGEAE